MTDKDNELDARYETFRNAELALKLVKTNQKLLLVLAEIAALIEGVTSDLERAQVEILEASKHLFHLDSAH
jgi:hypothetical protein